MAERVFDISPQAEAEAVRIYWTNLSDTEGYLDEVQRLREQRDPGLAHVYQELSPSIGTFAFKFGAAITYTAMRFGLDETNPLFRLEVVDVDDFVQDILARHPRRGSNLPLAIAQAEGILWNNRVSIRREPKFGPQLGALLGTHEDRLNMGRSGRYQKLGFIAGSYVMAQPILQKLGHGEMTVQP